MGDGRGYRVLLVGCGELGSRHLQAVASLPEVGEIDVIDPRPEALQLGRGRLGEVRELRRPESCRWLSSLEDAQRGGDLCIVATQAGERCQVVRQVAEVLGYRLFLIEKIVAQSVQDYEGLVDFARSKTLAVWVNCKTRAYPFHQGVKRRLDPRDPIVFSVVGGNHGLANNGVHAADLFAFYDGGARIEPEGSSIDPTLHPSKRGRHLFDLSGTLHGSTVRGSRFTLSYAGDHANSEQITIATRRYRCVVDHMQRWAVESDAGSGWGYRPVPFEGDLMVSQMTKRFAAEILSKGRCELPTLEEALVGHRFILDALRPHFSRLMRQEVALCPVT